LVPSEDRLYHRKDGKVVKEGDDLMSATQCAVMMLRFASTKAAHDKFRRKLTYSNIGMCETKFGWTDRRPFRYPNRRDKLHISVGATAPSVPACRAIR
jgi:hypothetical protein